MPDVVTPACRQFGERILRRLVDAEKLPPTAKLNCEASSGDYVLDVVMLGPNEWWMGWHQVASFGQRWPGGVPQFTPPNPMVSRAYLKMREAISWSGFPFRQGDRCIDLGSAPGGASQALLEEGLVVMGVDPAEMDPFVLAHPNFVHVRKRGADVRRREYRGYKWLVADSNVAPAQTLETLEAIVTHPSTSIQGLLITFKLANWELAQELPEYAQRVQSWGYRDVRCRQLAGNHLEVCMAALRARGIRRRRVQRVNLADQAETPVT
jgi:23S rRNA (cytidine2498-2'-O)-methyltransferase